MHANMIRQISANIEIFCFFALEFVIWEFDVYTHQKTKANKIPLPTKSEKSKEKFAGFESLDFLYKKIESHISKMATHDGIGDSVASHYNRLENNTVDQRKESR